MRKTCTSIKRITDIISIRAECHIALKAFLIQRLLISIEVRKSTQHRSKRLAVRRLRCLRRIA